MKTERTIFYILVNIQSQCDFGVSLKFRQSVTSFKFLKCVVVTCLSAQFPDLRSSTSLGQSLRSPHKQVSGCVSHTSATVKPNIS